MRRDRELWTRAAQGPAQHVPDDNSVDNFSAMNNFRAEPRMKTGPGVFPGIGAWILAERPDYEFIGVGRPLKDIRIIPIQAALCLDTTRPAIRQMNLVVVPVVSSSGNPINDQSS
ncbi:MAG: hypothetical protein IT163_20480 [Bryobacterales bacterium]|nr:hypothetical protein [Bryobacterales bacterium]